MCGWCCRESESEDPAHKVPVGKCRDATKSGASQANASGQACQTRQHEYSLNIVCTHGRMLIGYKSSVSRLQLLRTEDPEELAFTRQIKYTVKLTSCQAGPASLEIDTFSPREPPTMASWGHVLCVFQAQKVGSYPMSN